MEFFPDLRTFLRIELGGFTLNIAWYALLILTGAILAYYLSVKNAKKLGYSKQLLEDFFFMMMPLVIVGARIWYVVFEWDQYSGNPMKIFEIWEGGLAIHGGLVTGIVFAYFYFRKKGVNLLRVGDCIMPNVLLGQVIGRWGNFLNQEAYGEIVSADYFNGFPSFIKDNMYINGAYRQPMFLYEGIGNLIGFFLITVVYKRWGRKRSGDLIYAYIVWYGIVRFFVEIFRTDALMLGGIRVAQLTSIGFILIGLLGILGVYNKVFKKFYPFRKEKPVILFDADGTLIDSENDVFLCFNHTLKTNLDFEISFEKFKTLAGMTMENMFKEVIPEGKKHLNIVMTEKYRKYYVDENHVFDTTTIFEGVTETLKDLKEQGFLMAIVSSKAQRVLDYMIEHFKFTEFDLVVGSGAGSFKHKPDPEILNYTLDKFNASPKDAVMIGDAGTDILAGKNANMDTIAVTYGFDVKENLVKCNPTFVIDKFSELTKIIKYRK
jgi:phosphatidylglycerol:prolipoprotein diacylglycerol transferase